MQKCHYTGDLCHQFNIFLHGNGIAPTKPVFGKNSILNEPITISFRKLGKFIAAAMEFLMQIAGGQEKIKK